MKKSVEKLINMFFGKTAKKRFKRAAIVIVIVGGFMAILFTCSFSYDIENGFQFGSKPIKTEININGGK